MMLNSPVASILAQAASRVAGVTKSRFQPNPDTSDHTGKKVDYEIHVEGSDKPYKGLLIVEAKTLNATPAEVLGAIIGHKVGSRSWDEQDTKTFLDTPIKRLMEM